MNTAITLDLPKTSGANEKRACEVVFFRCHYENGTWQREAVEAADLAKIVGDVLLMCPTSGSGQRGWEASFPQGTKPPAGASFVAKIPGRAELVRLAWLPRERWLPVGVTPVAWPTGQHGAYCVEIYDRPYWSIRQRLLAIQEMLLDLLVSDTGVAVTGSPAKVPASLKAAVGSLKDALQEVTKKPRDYAYADAELTATGQISAAWSSLAGALRSVGKKDTSEIADELAKVNFPAAAAASPGAVGAEAVRCAKEMHGAMSFAARKHAREKAHETLRLSTLVRDHGVAREHFFATMEAVYRASKDMAPMATSSTGTESFQRGVHGAVIEEAFREWLKARLAPLAVSTGTIVGAPAKNQLDVIIWDPRYIAAVVRVGEVAYVPAPAVRGIMEVKGGYPAPGEVAQRLYEIQAIHAALCSQDNKPAADVPIIGVLIADTKQYETVAGKGAGLVASLFLLRGPDLRRNEEAFRRIQRFLLDVAEYAA